VRVNHGDLILLFRRPSSAERQPREYARRQRLLRIGLGTAVPVALVVLWQIASTRGWIDSRLYPSPSRLVGEARDLESQGKLWPNLWATTRRILVGFALGATAGVLVGMVMGVFDTLRWAFEPLLNALYTVPKLALLPLFLTVFKYGEAPIYALILTTVFFFVWISTLEAMLSVPEGYREAVLSLKRSRWQLFRHALLPASLPQIFVGLRITAGVSVLVVLGVEFIYGGSGIGYLIIQGKTLFIPKQMYVAIVVAALLGIACIGVVDIARRLAIPWAGRDRSRSRG